MKSAAFSTGVREGDARSPGQLPRILKRLRLPIHSASAKQVHGNRVQRVVALARAREFPATDGFLTDAPDQPLIIFTADCLPLFLEAGDGGVVGLLHAGWRGVHNRILARAVCQVRHTWGIPAKKITAWAGPHIGGCCFEVQWDVARHFPRTRRSKGDRWTVDLEGEMRAQARRLGLRWASKKGFRGCTMHQSRYYSYRRNQTSKRQISVIMKRKYA